MSKPVESASITDNDRTAGAGKPKVRDRIFDTACDLFYRQGIRCVGVDAIVSEAGTNKMSFYRSFVSKDELVAEYLREHAREKLIWWDEVVAGCPDDPRTQAEVLIDAFVTKVRKRDTCGCPFVNAAVELREADHPALEVIHGFKAEMRRRFRKLAREMGARDPEVLGDALTLLVEGCIMSRLSFVCQEGPYVNAAKAARSLIDAYC